MEALRNGRRGCFKLRRVSEGFYWHRWERKFFLHGSLYSTHVYWVSTGYQTQFQVSGKQQCSKTINISSSHRNYTSSERKTSTMNR